MLSQDPCRPTITGLLSLRLMPERQRSDEVVRALKTLTAESTRFWEPKRYIDKVGARVGELYMVPRPFHDEIDEVEVQPVWY